MLVDFLGHLLISVSILYALYNVIGELRKIKTALLHENQHEIHDLSHEKLLDEQGVNEDIYMLDNGLYSYKAYRTKMAEKYDRPKDVRN